MHKLALLALLASSLAHVGCATLTASKSEVLAVQSDPPGAEIRVDGVTTGRTPGSVELDKSRMTAVQVAMPGFAPQTCSTRMSPGTTYLVSDALLCVFLFPFGCVAFIDATGSWNQLENRTCYVRLGPDNGQQPYQPAYPQPPNGFPPAPQQGFPPSDQNYPPPQAYPPPPPPSGGYPPPPPPQR